jgi:hypothetical protein
LYLGSHLLHVEHESVERLLDVGLLLGILLPPALQPRLQLHLELRLRRSAAPINLLQPRLHLHLELRLRRSAAPINLLRHGVSNSFLSFFYSAGRCKAIQKGVVR